MKWASHQPKPLLWDFFPNSSAVLVDKVHKFHTTLIELGGQESERIFSTIPPSDEAYSGTSGFLRGVPYKGAGMTAEYRRRLPSPNTQVIRNAIAVHATCYESWNKVTGLKVS